MQNKGPRIRQGSPQEEEALISHIVSLEPSSQRLQEVGELNEFLVLLGHESDAKKLQNLLSDVIAKQSKAALEAQKQEPSSDTPSNTASAQKDTDAKSVNKVADKKPNITWKWDILRAT